MCPFVVPSFPQTVLPWRNAFNCALPCGNDALEIVVGARNIAGIILHSLGREGASGSHLARQLSIRRKGDPPEILHPVVLFEKLDSVGADALQTGDLRDHSGERLSATIISYNDSRSDQ
jgi:hypothetical protein